MMNEWVLIGWSVFAAMLFACPGCFGKWLAMVDRARYDARWEAEKEYERRTTIKHWEGES